MHACTARFPPTLPSHPVDTVLSLSIQLSSLSTRPALEIDVSMPSHRISVVLLLDRMDVDQEGDANIGSPSLSQNAAQFVPHISRCAQIVIGVHSAYDGEGGDAVRDFP